MSTTPINPAIADSLAPIAMETIGDYLVPQDPMDDLGCDSCQ